MASDHAASSSEDSKQPAPWLPIPPRAISAVEHPCVVKNVDKAVTSLGGPVKLSKDLRSKLEPRLNEEGQQELPPLISLSLRPDDPTAKRLLSTPVATRNLLLKVTVPKRTGRKRKRGSPGPFLAELDPANGTPQDRNKEDPYVDASAVFRSLQDNASRYSVSLAGIIDETHRARDIPDIQYAASTNSTMANIKQHLLPLSYRQLKKFDLNTATGANLAKDVGPSAEFVQMPIAYNYRYQQNPFVKYTRDSKEINLQKSLTRGGYHIIKADADSVPTGPMSHLPPEANLSPYLQTLIASIRAELERRPIITRHILYNKLGWDKRYRLKQAAVYCGYFFESGAWREALVKWGVDPRKHPAYRKYQTISFLSYLKTGTSRHHDLFDRHTRELALMHPRELEKQHMFDGVTVSHTGSLFQFCDITDPLIRRILDTKDIRTTCAPTFQGWYHAGTWAKATVILKDKMNTIIGGETADNVLYERIMKWPETWDDKELFATYKEEVYNRQFHKEMAREHAVMASVRWAARNPRYAFEKMEARKTQEVGQDDQEPEEVEVPEDMTEVPETVEAILNEDDDDDDEDDYNEDDESEQDQDDDLDGVWEADDDYDSDTMGLPAVRDPSLGPAPFGGLYRV